MKIVALLLVPFAIGCTTLKKPFFYEITKGDSKAYLLGTVHTGVTVDHLPFFVMNIFSQARKVGVESDPLDISLLSDERREFDSAVERLKNSVAVHKDSSLPKKPWTGPKLSDRISQKSFQYVNKIFLPFFKVAEIIETFSPQVAFFLLVALESSHAGYRTANPALDQSMDLNLLKRARSEKKSLLFLDGDNLNIGNACKDELFDQLIQEIGEPRTNNALERAYRSGDEHALLKETQKELSPQLKKCLIDDRNSKWVKAIEENAIEAAFNKLPPPFFAFGAAHLFGSNSVLEQLTVRGFAIRRIEKP